MYECSTKHYLKAYIYNYIYFVFSLSQLRINDFSRIIKLVAMLRLCVALLDDVI